MRLVTILFLLTTFGRTSIAESMRYLRRLASAVCAVALLSALSGCAGTPDEAMQDAAAAMREAEAAEADDYASDEIRAAREELLQAKSALADEEASLVVLKGLDRAGDHFSRVAEMARRAAEVAKANREAILQEAERLRTSADDMIRGLERQLMQKGVPIQRRVLFTAGGEGPQVAEGNVIFRGGPPTGGQFMVAAPPPGGAPPAAEGAQPAKSPSGDVEGLPPPGGQKVVRFFGSGTGAPGGRMMPGGPPPKPARLSPELAGLRTKIEMIHFSFSLGIDFFEQGQANDALRQFRETIAKCEFLQEELGIQEDLQ